MLAEILHARTTTRLELAAVTGLSSATVSRAVDTLLAEGVVRETSDIETGLRGRRAVQIVVVADLAFVSGVDLGASTTRIVIADLLAHPVRVQRLPTPRDLDPVALAEWLAAQIADVRGDSLSLAAIRVGVPGAVASDDQAVTNAPNLPQVEDPAFLSTLRRVCGIPLHIDNDANYALLGEQKFGAAKDALSAGMVTIGTGLGAAIAIDGRIIRGRRGIVGEFGHLLVGPLGTRLENLVTGPMITRRAAELGHPLATPAELFREEAPAQLAPLASEFDHALLVVLTALIVSSDPAIVVLGGRIAHSLGPRLAAYEDELERNLHVRVPLALATLDDYSGAMGAVVASLQGTYAEMGVPPAQISTLPAARTLDPDELSSEP
ncbi:MAG: hypothetical protein JWP75_1947 [Frondihabitans sp.]|nr:hypothetical protein [Frondihabitans sp.]